MTHSHYRMQPASADGQLHRIAVSPLTALVRLFVSTFGITQPSPENEERAGRVILAMLIGVVLMVAVVGWVLRGILTR